MKTNEVILALDIGTGSTRGGLVDSQGNVIQMASHSHETYFPSHGQVEQDPRSWWQGVCEVTHSLTRYTHQTGLHIAAICACGQMHAPVLLSEAGALVSQRAHLWNDKRSEPQVAELRRDGSYEQFTAIAGNPAAPSWPGLKLAWIAQNAPEILERAAVILMPKDYINFRLTGKIAQDRTEAGSSFLFDCRTEDWSSSLTRLLNVPESILPKILPSCTQLGTITQDATNETGIARGTPVFVGGGDYPVAVLGSGVTRVGQISDITGTSSLISRISEKCTMEPGKMNAAATSSNWMSFSVVDAAGDAIRWGRRALEQNAVDFAELTDQAYTVAPGSDGLLFLPYLTGERLGHGRNSRAAFLGLTATHGKSHMHRAIVEGVCLAIYDAAAPLLGGQDSPDIITAAGGGARSQLMLQIKAAIFETPFQRTKEVECGLLGCAAIAMTGLGHFSNEADAAAQLVRYDEPVLPDPELVKVYRPLKHIFADLRSSLRGPLERLNELNP